MISGQISFAIIILLLLFINENKIDSSDTRIIKKESSEIRVKELVSILLFLLLWDFMYLRLYTQFQYHTASVQWFHSFAFCLSDRIECENMSFERVSWCRAPTDK